MGVSLSNQQQRNAQNSTRADVPGITEVDATVLAQHETSSVSMTVGIGGQLSSSGAGFESDNGSTTTSTEDFIARMAGNQAARTGDAESDLPTAPSTTGFWRT